MLEYSIRPIKIPTRSVITLKISIGNIGFLGEGYSRQYQLHDIALVTIIRPIYSSWLFAY